MAGLLPINKGRFRSNRPPNGPMGTPPDGFGGGPGGPGGMPGGRSSFSGEYNAVLTIDSDAVLTDNLTSTGTDENALLITGGI